MCSPEGEEKWERIRGFVTNSVREQLLSRRSPILFFILLNVLNERSLISTFFCFHIMEACS